jgi:predicted RNA-binding protein with PIN domain
LAYLIDGNNVMALTSGWHRDPAGARRRLIHQLACFVAATRARVTVVFDGPSDADFPGGTRFRSVTVLYAKPGSDADNRIKDMLRNSSYRRDTVVVTSDRPLGSFAAGQGSKVMRSHEFRNLLTEACEEWRSRNRNGLDEPVDIEEWLEFFGTPQSR